LDDHKVEAKEIVSASKKLDAKDAAALAKAATRVIVAKGAKVAEYEPGKAAGREIVDAMLGPTGNLRAPCLRVGKTLLVGFNADAYRDVLL
jgi:arsenate reductase-like glutaredoxin family protein